MNYNYDYFISYAPEDNEDGFVDEFVKRLKDSAKLQKLFGPELRVFYDKGAVRGSDDWERKIQPALGTSRYMLVLLSPNYFQSERCAQELEWWVNDGTGQYLLGEGLLQIQIADTPGLFDNEKGAKVAIPKDLRTRFPDWVFMLHDCEIEDPVDLRNHTTGSINRALAALYSAGRYDVRSEDWAKEKKTSRPQDGSSPKDAKKSAAELPDDPQALFDLCVSYNRTGAALETDGKHKQAREHYEKAVEAGALSVELAPDNVEAAFYLGLTYVKLGVMAKAKDKFKKTREYHKKAVETLTKVLGRTQDDLLVMNALAVSYDQLGDLAEGEFKPKRAIGYYEKALEIRKIIVERNPDDRNALRELGLTYENLGSLADSEFMKKLAREYYEKALETRTQLVERSPDDHDALRGLGSVYAQLGVLLSDDENVRKQAKEYLEKAREILSKIVESSPLDLLTSDTLRTVYLSLADLADAEGNHKQAKAYRKKGAEYRCSVFPDGF